MVGGVAYCSGLFIATVLASGLAGMFVRPMLQLPISNCGHLQCLLDLFHVVEILLLIYYRRYVNFAIWSKGIDFG